MQHAQRIRAPTRRPLGRAGCCWLHPCRCHRSNGVALCCAGPWWSSLWWRLRCSLHLWSGSWRRCVRVYLLAARPEVNRGLRAFSNFRNCQRCLRCLARVCTHATSRAVTLDGGLTLPLANNTERSLLQALGARLGSHPRHRYRGCGRPFRAATAFQLCPDLWPPYHLD